MLGFIEGPAGSRKVKTVPFIEDELVLIASTAHEWAERTSVSCSEITSISHFWRFANKLYLKGRNGFDLPSEKKQPTPATDNLNIQWSPVELIRAEVEKVLRTRISGPKGLLSLYGALCLSLAFMVFAWGTSYKLSLYKAGHPSIPAKVCTRGSDAAKNAIDHIAGGSTLAHAPISIVVLFSALQETGGFPLDRLRDEAISDLSPLTRAPILCLRPPPDEGRALD